MLCLHTGRQAGRGRRAERSTSYVNTADLCDEQYSVQQHLLNLATFSLLLQLLLLLLPLLLLLLLPLVLRLLPPLLLPLLLCWLQ